MNNFLKPSSFQNVPSMISSLENGIAFVYLIISHENSFALVVTSCSIESIWIDFTHTDLKDILIKSDEKKGGFLAGQLNPQQFLFESLNEMLPILGEKLVKPIADQCHIHDIKHVVFIPTGLSGILPLHAAKYKRNDNVFSFLDEFLISYTPNAQSLMKMIDSLEKNTNINTFFGVGNPSPHPNPLEYSEIEVSQISTYFPDEKVNILLRENANRNMVLKNLSEYNFLHFSCHGSFDFEHPLNSGLQLSNQETVTLEDFMYGCSKPEKARLTILSACQSAISDLKQLPDEVFGLPTGILQAGVPGVIGTLWPVEDLSTAILMIKFYELLIGVQGNSKNLNAFQPIKALRKAQLWLRDLTWKELFEFINSKPLLKNSFDSQILDETTIDDNSQPYKSPFYWAPFIYIGI